MPKSRRALTRRAATMNQPTENQPTFNSCNSSWPHITYLLQMINRAARLVRAHLDFSHHGGKHKHNDFCCFKGVTYVALTLCHKLISFLHWLAKSFAFVSKGISKTYSLNVGRIELPHGCTTPGDWVPICCFVSKWGRLKDECCRKSWPNFALLDPQ